MYGPGERPTPTTDLESTTDLQGGHTTDLAPVTTDIEAPAIVGSPKLERVDAPQTLHAKPLAPGAVINDRFILERVVGKGGTAVVYQARDMTASSDTTASVRVALKAPHPDRADRARAMARLQHEFAQASKLSHPNIVRMFELIEHADSCFITMELIEGRLLSTIVRDWTMLPRALANKILRCCAQALHHAHENDVVHGDFKPGNVFLTREEDVKTSSATRASRTNCSPASIRSSIARRWRLAMPVRRRRARGISRRRNGWVCCRRSHGIANSARQTS
jgi:hypothetical protein